MPRSTSLRVLLLAIVALSLGAAPALATPTVSGEFATPNIETNNKIIEGPDGNVWLTLSEAGKDVAKVTPAGVVTPYDIEAVTPSGIAVGPEERIWVTRNGGVVTFDPADPEGTKVATAVAEIGISHSIVRGPDNNMWVATPGKVLRIQASDPTKVTPFPIAGLDPKDIDTAGQLLAVADAGAQPRIVTLTTAGVPTSYEIPGGSQGVAGAPSGLIGFSQQAKVPEQVGLISPPTLLPLVETPGGVGDPFGAALGADGDFWFAMSGSDSVSRLTPGGTLTVLGGFPKLSFPRQLTPGPANTLWVTLDMTNKVARISGLEPPVTPPAPPPPAPPKIPTTKIEKGPKGTVGTTKKLKKVKFRFSSDDAAASFQCRIKRLPPKRKGAQKSAKKKAVAWKTCRSPKAYELRPGNRYRFEVRAVNAAGVDPTPAKRTFKVISVEPISD